MPTTAFPAEELAALLARGPAGLDEILRRVIAYERTTLEAVGR